MTQPQLKKIKLRLLLPLVVAMVAGVYSRPMKAQSVSSANTAFQYQAQASSSATLALPQGIDRARREDGTCTGGVEHNWCWVSPPNGGWYFQTDPPQTAPQLSGCHQEPAGDGCNSCTVCDNGYSACTLAFCMPVAKPPDPVYLWPSETPPIQENKRWTCSDKRSVLLTAEDGTKHCILFAPIPSTGIFTNGSQQ